MVEEVNIRGEDIPLEQLVPLHERKINLKSNAGFRKILSSIGEIGLIEPLCVYRDGDSFIILDGYLRFKACEQLGVERVPCILYPSKEAYTFNRMVNRLSPLQEIKMLRRSLETVDQATIAKVFGMRSIQHRLGTHLLEQLHPRVVEAFDKNLVGKLSANELTYVKPDRQLEILQEMERTGDYSASLARALVVKTPPSQRVRGGKRKKPWDRQVARRRELVTKLEEVEKRHDFYSRLYNQYSTDLLKLCSFARKLITHDALRGRLESDHREILERFAKIVFDGEGAQAG